MVLLRGQCPLAGLGSTPGHPPIRLFRGLSRLFPEDDGAAIRACPSGRNIGAHPSGTGAAVKQPGYFVLTLSMYLTRLGRLPKRAVSQGANSRSIASSRLI